METTIKLILDNIRARRSVPPVRMCADAIEESVLMAIIDAGNWAPAHRRSFPWRFHVFEGGSRKELGKALAKAYRAHMGSDYDPKKNEKLLKKPLMAGAVIGIVMQPPDPPVNPEVEEILAMGCAVQNIHLAAFAFGLAGYWTTPRYMDHAVIRGFLDIPDSGRCLGFFYLGHFDSSWPKNSRPKIDAKLVRHR